jgi:hypothetical protein
MPFINLSDHPTVVLDPNTPVKTFDGGRSKYADDTPQIVLELPSYKGALPNVDALSGNTVVIDGVSIEYPDSTVINNLPEPKEGIIYISSEIVVNAAKTLGRTDVVYPGPLVFKEPFEKGFGTIVGCLGLRG